MKKNINEQVNQEYVNEYNAGEWDCFEYIEEQLNTAADAVNYIFGLMMTGSQKISGAYLKGWMQVIENEVNQNPSAEESVMVALAKNLEQF